MTVQEYLEHAKKYKDADGLMQIDGSVSQNGVLFSAEYVYALEGIKKRLTNEEDKILLTNEANAIRKACDACLKDGAFLFRSVKRPDEYDSMDNYTAYVSLKLTEGDTTAASEMIRIGEAGVKDIHNEDPDPRTKKYFELAKIIGFGKARYVFNNQAPSKFCFFSWYGRSPAMVGYIKQAAKKSGFFNDLSVLVGQLTTLFQKNRNDLDPRKLAYVAWQGNRDMNLFYKLGYWLFMRKIKKDYPGGITEVYQMYYSDQKHPLILAESVL